MNTSEQINAIIAARPTELLLEVLWSDQSLKGKIRVLLNKVPTENIKYYYNYFCGEDNAIKN